MTADVLCVGAHPDDIEIGMGGLVAKLTGAGVRVAFCDITDGEPTPRGTPERRREEAERAASVLGVYERRILSFPNRELFDGTEPRYSLAEVMREVRPKVVFGPYPLDAHPDHVAAARIVEAARFYAKFTKTSMAGDPYHPPRLFRYHAMHLRAALSPSWVADVSDTMGRKLEALGTYRSQFGDADAEGGVIEAVRTLGAHWGRLCGVASAEPFDAPEVLCVREPAVLW